MTATPHQRGFFDGLLGREGETFFEWDGYADYAAYWVGYKAGWAALNELESSAVSDPQETARP